MQAFEALGLSPELVRALTEGGITTPTEIQDKAIPELVKRDPDFLGLAQTGTGKTVAFGLPLLDSLDHTWDKTQAVVLAPTRELARQIAEELQNFAKYKPKLDIAIVYGGTPIGPQVKSLRKRTPHLVIGTPGRVIDLLGKRAIDFHEVEHLVLDEADEMLNMGFQEEIDRILSAMPEGKRTWLFSATMPKEIRKIVDQYMTDPVEVRINPKQETNANIEHRFVRVRRPDKVRALKRIIDFNPELYGVVFCRTKHDTQQVADRLSEDGYPAEALHGDLSQEARDAVMRRFKKKRLQILVATDVAARGIDVNDLTHVIHMALPDDKAYYTHRSGRTARAGKMGVSIAIIAPEEGRKLKSLEHYLGIQVEYLKLPGSDQVLEIKMKDWADRIRDIDISNVGERSWKKVDELLKDVHPEELLHKLLAREILKLEKGQDLKDLNVSAKPDRDRGPRQGGNRRERSDFKSPKDVDRFFINIGSRDRVHKGDLLRLICDQTRLSKKEIGNIDIHHSCAFFEVDKRYSKKVAPSFTGLQVKGRGIRVNRDNKKG